MALIAWRRRRRSWKALSAFIPNRRNRTTYGRYRGGIPRHWGGKGGQGKAVSGGDCAKVPPPPAFHLEKSVPCFVARGGTYSSQGKRCTAMQFWYCAMASRDASTWTLLSCSHRRRPLS